MFQLERIKDVAELAKHGEHLANEANIKENRKRIRDSWDILKNRISKKSAETYTRTRCRRSSVKNKIR